MMKYSKKIGKECNIRLLKGVKYENFKNQNNDIKIKNSGEIDLNKQNVRGFVLSGFNAVPTSETAGVEGEMNYFGSNLYIYLGGNWNKVTLASI